MSTLYDPRVSAACLALREDPPAALDGPILQYARDALDAAEVLRNANPSVWRRRTFAAIVAFIGVVSVTSIWESSSEPAPQPAPIAPAIEPIALPAPVAIAPPAAARLEATPPVVVAKPKAATVTKKKLAPTPATVERKADAPPTRTGTTAAAIPDEPVQVKTIAVDDGLAPTPLAPPDPAPAIETTKPSPAVCAANPLTEGCAPSF